MKVERPVIFISDGDNPFGEAVLRRFAEEGQRIIVNSRSKGALRESVVNSGAEVIEVQLDLCDRAAVEGMLDEHTSPSSPVGLFVHTCNTVLRCDVESCSEELFDETIRRNLKSAFVCTQAIGHRMRGEGKLVYLGSIHGEKPTRSAFAYSVAMGALTMLCREAALELGRNGVNVNLIEMGPVPGDDERFGDDLFPLYASYEAKVPRGRAGTPDDAARLVRFIASEDAAFLNGSSVRLDGGFLLHYLDQNLPSSPGASNGNER